LSFQYEKLFVLLGLFHYILSDHFWKGLLIGVMVKMPYTTDKLMCQSQWR